MAVTSSPDDGFREIQLSGKQLVFLFMAATVVLVVTFLTGVLVGRGVRAERTSASEADVLNESPVLPQRSEVEQPSENPTMAPPPAPVEEEPAGKATGGLDEQPPKAVDRPAVVPRETPAPATPAPAKPAPEPARPAPTRTETAKVEPAKPAPAKAEPAKAAPATAGGYAVQVVAVNVRGEADAIVKRLASKSYSAYVETPKGNSAVFRVRVGPFKTRREAQAMADRLKREEKFKPWVTR